MRGLERRTVQDKLERSPDVKSHYAEMALSSEHGLSVFQCLRAKQLPALKVPYALLQAPLPFPSSDCTHERRKPRGGHPERRQAVRDESGSPSPFTDEPDWNRPYLRKAEGGTKAAPDAAAAVCMGSPPS